MTRKKITINELEEMVRKEVASHFHSKLEDVGCNQLKKIYDHEIMTDLLNSVAEENAKLGDKKDFSIMYNELKVTAHEEWENLRNDLDC